jgi:DNA-binding GntR family transcriptional regulator
VSMQEATDGHSPSLRRVARVAAPVREQLREIVRDAIMSGEYAPGARLIERELCERTGASRTSVREVLRQLEAENLVMVVPNRGTIVSVVTHADATDIYEVREVLEGLSARRFAERAGDEHRSRLHEILDELRNAARDNDHRRALSIKDDFYDVLLDGAGNSVVRATLEGLRSRISMLRNASLSQPGRLRNTVAEIEELIEAMDARDADRAEQASRSHVRNAAAVALTALATKEGLEDIAAAGSP